MSDIIDQLTGYAAGIDLLEFLGLIFGLLAVYYLIRQNILTWPTGIIYVLISLVIFTQAKLYADLILHIFYLVLNIYGWYYWIHGRKKDEVELPVTTTGRSLIIILIAVSFAGIFLMGYVLSELTDASLPYWDSTTTVLSFTGMWLTARKKIESWAFWLIVDIVATGVYIFKDIYFYAFLYFIYIGLAVSGYLSWRKSMLLTSMEPISSNG